VGVAVRSAPEVTTAAVPSRPGRRASERGGARLHAARRPIGMPKVGRISSSASR